MAWEKTHRITVQNMDRKQIWKVWEDVNQWHAWDLELEFAKLEGAFASGNYFLLKPKGGPKLKIKLAKVQPQASFTDVTSFPFAKMYGIHEMRETKDGLEVAHTVRIEGPLGFLWRKIVAENVAAGLEKQATQMIARAREVR